ncbi:MAG: transposase, partial [Candidatus Delongbacteria bacterium]|nr:transposase [Candidatus Delongbacteria bacterium]
NPSMLLYFFGYLGNFIFHFLGNLILRVTVYRLMHELGIKAIYPKRNLSIPNKQHKKYPYLLRDLKIVMFQRFFYPKETN